MKLIFANNYHYLRGGVERVLFNEMEMLSSRGHTVAPFTRHYKYNLPTQYSNSFAPLFDYENSAGLGKVSAGLKLIYSWEVRKAFDVFLREFNPDVVHCHSIYGKLTTSILDAAKKRSVPVIMTLHDYKLVCPSYLMLNGSEVCESCVGGKFYNCVLKRCHKKALAPSAVYTVEAYFNKFFRKYDSVRYFISPSRFLMKIFASSGFDEKRLVHVPNFVDTREFEPCFENNGYVLFAGRLSKEKGLLTLLKAMEGLEIELKLVGDGPMRETCEKFIREKGMGNVKLVGYKTGTDLEDLFRKASLIVFPSEWYENAPMTILESFAYGKPVIASDMGGVSEMLIDGSNGLLYPTGNFRELRERIRYLAACPSKVIEMGMKARDVVEREYNVDVHYKRITEVYDRVLS